MVLSESDLNKRKANLTFTLNTIGTLYTEYDQRLKNQAVEIRQKTELENQKVALEAKLAAIKSSADTYDREFLDRTAGVGSSEVVRSGFWARRGFRTFQDWVLAAFFLAYALVGLGITGLLVARANKKLAAAFICLTATVIIGIMMAGMIMRFA